LSFFRGGVGSNFVAVMNYIPGNISKLNEANSGGGLYLDIIDFNLVNDFVVNDNKVIQNIYSNPANWSRIYFSKNSLRFRERERYKDGIRTYEAEILGDIPKDRKTVLDYFETLHKSRWVVVFRPRTGDPVIVGTKTQPAIFERIKRDGKRRPIDYNGFSIRFSVRKTFATPFYLPQFEHQMYFLNGEKAEWLNGEFRNYLN
jgi:hypothetical protein